MIRELVLVVVLVGVVAPKESTADARPAATSGKDTLEGCKSVGAADADSDIAADLGRTYRIRGTDLRVCVYRALYPYALHRGHKLYACYSVKSGSKRVKDVCGDGASYVDYDGHRISVWLRTPRYTEDCDVWLRVKKAPAPPKSALRGERRETRENATWASPRDDRSPPNVVTIEARRTS